MKKITIKTSKGKVSWGMDKIKYIIGNNIEWKHEVMSSLIAHFSSVGLSEYDEEKFSDWKVHVNDDRNDSKKSYFVQMNQYYDYETHAKMTAQSMLTAYVGALSKNLPYTDEYATYNTIYKSLMDEHSVNKLNISSDDVSMEFDSIPVTPKIFQKSLRPHLMKEHLEANGFDLTLHEAVDLQCKVIKRLANAIVKEVVILYDGPVTVSVKKSLEELVTKSKNIMCIVNVQGNHSVYKSDVEKYIMIGVDCVDLASIYEIAEKIEMDMPYAGDRESFVEDLNNYSKGKITSRNGYLYRFLGYL